MLIIQGVSTPATASLSGSALGLFDSAKHNIGFILNCVGSVSGFCILARRVRKLLQKHDTLLYQALKPLLLVWILGMNPKTFVVHDQNRLRKSVRQLRSILVDAALVCFFGLHSVRSSSVKKRAFISPNHFASANQPLACHLPPIACRVSTSPDILSLTAARSRQDEKEYDSNSEPHFFSLQHTAEAHHNHASHTCVYLSPAPPCNPHQNGACYARREY